VTEQFLNCPLRANVHRVKLNCPLCPSGHRVKFIHGAEESARFYASTLPESTFTVVHKAPADFPGGKRDAVLTVEFTVCGVSCIDINGGDASLFPKMTS
jgi:predicted 3-demethylubiquinone-9 3-methyltransferase (glyoxalase superfamily)